MQPGTEDAVKLLAIGDIMGESGKRTVENRLEDIRREEEIDFTFANVENLSGGLGVTPESADEMLSLGVDVLTSGNHIWAKKEIKGYLEKEIRILRPFNYSKEKPGRGTGVYKTGGDVRIGVINALGSVFIENGRSPFKNINEAVSKISEKADIVIMDFHAEATSEKNAMGWYMNGKISGVVGTHTHIPTADERILPGGTAYITDVGMTGSYDSVIGINREDSLERFVFGRNVNLRVAGGEGKLCGAVLSVDPETGRAVDIKRLEVPR